jgi:hypothetical protein
MNKAKHLFTTVLVVFGALLVGAFVMSNIAPSPVSAAKDHCVQQGWGEHELSLSGFETSARISGSEGTVRFIGDKTDQRITILVELRKGLFAPKWRIVEYDETEIDDEPRDAE